ncbi:MAG: hypothetical protein ABSF22_03955 [Bryobacteraceae bacterium]
MNPKLILIACGCGLTLTAQAVVNNGGAGPEVKHRVVTQDDVKLGEIEGIFRAGLPLKTGAIQLHRMGDEAAVFLIKMLGSMPSATGLTDTQKRTVFVMLNTAFEHPNAINNPSNVAPNATSFLLNTLEETTQDPELKTQISQLRVFASGAATRRTINQ